MPNMYYGGSCDECGARVELENRGIHTKFHAKMDELIDWAQSVSQLFQPKPAPQREWEPGDPIE